MGWKFVGLFPVLAVLASCGKQPATEAPQAAPSKPAKILQFYAGSPTVARGEQVLICYGVEDAKTVRLDPPIEQITPSFVRCFQHAPSATSQIKLIATGADGAEVSKSIEITVAGVAAPPKGQLILFFASSSKSVPAGQQVTLCYETRNASSVKIEPSPTDRKLSGKDCVTAEVKQRTRYTLVASGPGGVQDRESVQVDVTR